MERKTNMDAFGAVALIGFSVLLGVNQVVIKLVNEGLQPVFFAGIRSAGAALCVAGWMAFRGHGFQLARAHWASALAAGIAFGLQFILLFVALDLTTVTRTSVIFYSMPLWLTLGAHLILPGEGITPLKAVGLVLAFAGVAWAMFARDAGGTSSVLGDLAALGAAMFWAAIALIIRGTRLKEARPEMQLLAQLVISAPILLGAAVFFGPFVRELTALHLWGVAFQILIVASAGFLFWLWLLSIYPAVGVASFSFLPPVVGVGLGWLILDEAVGPSLIGALVLVAIGIVLINRPARSG